MTYYVVKVTHLLIDGKQGSFVEWNERFRSQERAKASAKEYLEVLGVLRCKVLKISEEIVYKCALKKGQRQYEFRFADEKELNHESL